MSIELIYWDSATFLAYFQQEAGRVDQCRGTLKRAERGDVCIVSSALTIAECLWLRRTAPIPKDRARIVRAFFRHSYIRIRNVTRNIAERAQDLVWDQGVRPKDGIHVATAIEGRVPIFETFDQPLIRKSRTIGSPPLIIREPVATSQPRLFP